MSRKVSGDTHSQTELNHYSNQQNPNSSAYKASQDNRSNQLNPNHPEHKGK